MLLIALAVTFVWQGIARLSRHSRASAAGPLAPTTGSNGHGAEGEVVSGLAHGIPWERDVMILLESGIRDAQAGNLTGSEMDVDRASSLIETARLQLSPAAADFFASVVQQLDRVAAVHPENVRLVEHTRLVRIDLAELRSELAGPAPAVPATGSAAALATAVSSLSPTASKPSDGPSGGAATMPADAEDHHVTLGAPRSVVSGQDLTPKTFGGNYVDASIMPDTSEILEPPSTRLFVDNVRVENLTFQGAAQTLDGIHWHNVIFIGTRLRFEGGEVDLQNVHFVRCTFGFTTDERGARLANAIALGEPSIVIE